MNSGLFQLMAYGMRDGNLLENDYITKKIIEAGLSAYDEIQIRGNR